MAIRMKYPPRKVTRGKVREHIVNLSAGEKLPPLPEGIAYEDVYVELYAEEDYYDSYSATGYLYHLIDEPEEKFLARQKLYDEQLTEYRAWYKKNKQALDKQATKEKAAKEAKAKKEAVDKKKRLVREKERWLKRIKSIEKELSE